MCKRVSGTSWGYLTGGWGWVSFVHTDSCPCMSGLFVWIFPGVALTTVSAAVSPLRILSDAPKFRAECLQTLRDGEVEEESAAPPSIYTTITSTPLVHDFITYLTGEFRPRSEGKRFSNTLPSCVFSVFALVVVCGGFSFFFFPFFFPPSFCAQQRRVAATTRTVVSSPVASVPS